jgi:hypothetical protein
MLIARTSTTSGLRGRGRCRASAKALHAVVRCHAAAIDEEGDMPGLGAAHSRKWGRKVTQTP